MPPADLSDRWSVVILGWEHFPLRGGFEHEAHLRADKTGLGLVAAWTELLCPRDVRGVGIIVAADESWAKVSAPRVVGLLGYIELRGNLREILFGILLEIVAPTWGSYKGF